MHVPGDIKLGEDGLNHIHVVEPLKGVGVFKMSKRWARGRVARIVGQGGLEVLPPVFASKQGG